MAVLEIYKLPDLAQKSWVQDTPSRFGRKKPWRLQSGLIDVGFFYSTETADLKIPTIALPSVVALSARYTATVLRDAAHPDAAIKFVDFLLGPQGRAVMQEHGLDTAKPSVGGNPGKMPAQIRSEIDATK